jgi:hypothetical protein
MRWLRWLIRREVRREVERVMDEMLEVINVNTVELGRALNREIERVGGKAAEVMEIHGRMLGMLASVEVMILHDQYGRWAEAAFRQEWDLISSGYIVAMQAEQWLRGEGEAE